MQLADIRKLLLLSSTGFVYAIVVHSQTVSPIKHSGPIGDVIATYDGMRLQSHGGGGFMTQGGGIELHRGIASGVGVVVDATETRVGISGSLPGLDLFTVSIGPRITESRKEGRYIFFLQGLAGRAQGTHSFFPCPTGTCTHASGLEAQAGYGVDLRVRPSLMFRLIQADWVYTQLPNGGTNAENNFRFSTGVVLRLQ